LFSGFSSIILVVISDKCITLAGVVGVSDSSELLKLRLEFRVGCPFVDSVDKELAALFCIGSHGSWVVVRLVSHSLSSRITTSEPVQALTTRTRSWMEELLLVVDRMNRRSLLYSGCPTR